MSRTAARIADLECSAARLSDCPPDRQLVRPARVAIDGNARRGHVLRGHAGSWNEPGEAGPSLAPGFVLPAELPADWLSRADGATAVMVDHLTAAAVEATRRAACAGGIAAARALWRAHIRAVLWRSRSGPLNLEPAEAAAVLVALTDLPTRDVAAAWAVRREARELEPGAETAAVLLWADLCRRAPPPFDVAPAALLALGAWRQGRLDLARAAVDRALASDPQYRLAQLLDRVLVTGLRPPELKRHRRRVGGGPMEAG